MFNKIRLKQVLEEYKKVFVQQQWPDEKYKWEAIQSVQENWNINSGNFAQMLKKSLDPAGNLLASANNFPAKMIIGFAHQKRYVPCIWNYMTKVRIYVKELLILKTSPIHYWSAIQMELRNTISMKMQSWHIYGCAIQTNIISINSVK